MGNGCICYKDISFQEIKNDTFIDIKNEQVQTTNLYSYYIINFLIILN